MAQRDDASAFREVRRARKLTQEQLAAIGLEPSELIRRTRAILARPKAKK